MLMPTVYVIPVALVLKALPLDLPKRRFGLV